MRWVGAAAVGMCVAAPVQAQTFVDLFAGRSMPERTPVTLTAAEARVNDQIVPAALRVDVENARLSKSTIFGARVGHWFDWFGIAVDASTLNPDVRRQTVTATANLRLDEEIFGEPVTIDSGEARAVNIPRLGIPTTATIAALAMVRVPSGGVEPYAFAGPVYLVTDSDISGDWGLRAGGGVKFPISRRIALFGEYRFTRVDADAVAGRIGGEARGVTGTTGDIRADVNLRNHSLVGGVSFGF